MLNVLRRNWWVLALRGAVAILFGILAFIWPGVTLGALVLLFGAYVLLDGIFSLIAAFRDRQEQTPWWLLLLEGLAGIAAGIITFIWPGITAVVLLYLIAAWAVITGILEIIAAVRLREELSGELLLVLGGILSIIFGILLIIQPGAGALALIWLIAAYAIIFGIVLIALSLRIRSWQEDTQEWQTSTS